MVSESDRVLVEIRVSSGGEDAAREKARTLVAHGFVMDTGCPCICLPDPDEPDDGGKETFAFPGVLPVAHVRDVEKVPGVVKVWSDPLIHHARRSGDPAHTCEVVPKCTCARELGGDTRDVANVLGVDRLWGHGLDGHGVVVAMVDGGITAEGRPISDDDLASGDWDPSLRIPSVTGGYPEDWGTRGLIPWNWHGNMTAFDVLSLAPRASLLDIRISDNVTPDNPGARVSGACEGYCWALRQHRLDGTPHVMSNSWAMWQESHASDYARDIRHPLNRLVRAAVRRGITVVFAAGNCGDACPPNSRCGADTGPGSAIWGANGHPDAVTVGQATIAGELIGQSSPGPAALAKRKPDVLGISQFSGYFAGGDTGTSAAAAITSGVVALLKQARSSATPEMVKRALIETANGIGAPGFNRYTGYGIIDAVNAHARLLSLP